MFLPCPGRRRRCCGSCSFRRLPETSCSHRPPSSSSVVVGVTIGVCAENSVCDSGWARTGRGGSCAVTTSVHLRSGGATARMSSFFFCWAFDFFLDFLDAVVAGAAAASFSKMRSSRATANSEKGVATLLYCTAAMTIAMHLPVSPHSAPRRIGAKSWRYLARHASLRKTTPWFTMECA